MGSWPYRWAVSTSGPTLAKRRSRRRGFCCTILLRCGKGRGLPGPLVPLYCPGGFGRGKPLPYTQQRKKFGNVQGLFAPGPRQLGTVAGQGKALGVEAGTNRGADITHRMQRHLCDPTRLRAEPRTMHLPPSTAGWIPQGGGRPRLWRFFPRFLIGEKSGPAERPRRGRWFSPQKSEKNRPSRSAFGQMTPSCKGAICQAVTRVPHFPARASSPRSRLVMMAVRSRAERAN